MIPGNIAMSKDHFAAALVAREIGQSMLSNDVTHGQFCQMQRDTGDLVATYSCIQSSLACSWAITKHSAPVKQDREAEHNPISLWTLDDNYKADQTLGIENQIIDHCGTEDSYRY